LNFLEQLREKIAAEGLHRVVAEQLRKEGYAISELSDLGTAVRIFGEKLYEKNAHYRRIIEGLTALREVTR
jgi:hypothetical protein